MAKDEAQFLARQDQRESPAGQGKRTSVTSTRMAGNYNLGMRCSKRKGFLSPVETIPKTEIRRNRVEGSGCPVVRAINEVFKRNFEYCGYAAQRTLTECPLLVPSLEFREATLIHVCFYGEPFLTKAELTP
jgi:hypothetical protein